MVLLFSVILDVAAVAAAAAGLVLCFCCRCCCCCCCCCCSSSFFVVVAAAAADVVVVGRFLGLDAAVVVTAAAAFAHLDVGTLSVVLLYSINYSTVFRFYNYFIYLRHQIPDSREDRTSQAQQPQLSENCPGWLSRPEKRALETKETKV